MMVALNVINQQGMCGLKVRETWPFIKRVVRIGQGQREIFEGTKETSRFKP
jgi:hypothetical protein